MNQITNLHFQQSAVIPYRIQNGEIEILLITSIRNKRWIIPKGLIEANMTAAESAINEAWEEAGIKGKIWPKSVGYYTYNKWGGICIVEVFLLQVYQVFDDWLEANFRKRAWMSVEEAYNQVTEDELKEIIAMLPDIIVDDGETITNTATN